MTNSGEKEVAELAEVENEQPENEHHDKGAQGQQQRDMGKMDNVDHIHSDVVAMDADRLGHAMSSIAGLKSSPPQRQSQPRYASEYPFTSMRRFRHMLRALWLRL